MAKLSVRITLHKLRVLKLFLADGGVELAGIEVVTKTGLKPGSIYPILHVLERHGLLKGQWEKGDPVKLGRPLMRRYRITKQGQSAVERTLAELQ